MAGVEEIGLDFVRRVLIDQADFPNVAEMSKLRSRAILALCEGQGDELSGRGEIVVYYAQTAVRGNGAWSGRRERGV